MFYAVFAVCWIWVSELPLHLLHLSDIERFYVSAVKGTVFVVLTTAGLYVGLNRMVKRINSIQTAHRAELQGNEEQLKLFIEHAPAALAMFDSDMRYLRASSRWVQDYGLGGRNIIGCSHYDLFPEIPERWKEAHRRGMAGEVLRKNNDRFDREDGSLQWLKWEVRPWHHRSQGIGGIVIFSEEITAQKQAQAELKQLHEEFKEAQKMEAIGRLTGGIAHDFNNLLTVIMAQSELLERSSLDERALKRTRSIHHASVRAADLTRQLLAFSRKQVLQPSVQNVGEIVAGLTDMLDRILGEDIRLEISVGNNLWPVLVDRSQIEQVIMNLVVNARDAMPHGGELRLDTSNVHLEDDIFIDDVTLHRGNYVLLSVTDTGSGMSQDIREKIFEPFFTTKPHGKGTGLGLATVFGIVKQSGGVVSVETEVGKGTCFRVYLPHNAMNAVPAIAEFSEPYPVTGFNCSILLVDDEEELCSAVAEYLESAGHRVLKANSIVTALTIADQQGDDIDVVVTDLVLAEGNGKELTDRLKFRGCKARPVFISGYTDEVIADHGSLEADVLFLQKPFEKEALLQKVWQAYQDR
jgi:PAS domain S-box-containing protein